MKLQIESNFSGEDDFLGIFLFLFLILGEERENRKSGEDDDLGFTLDESEESVRGGIAS